MGTDQPGREQLHSGKSINRCKDLLAHPVEYATKRRYGNDASNHQSGWPYCVAEKDQSHIGTAHSRLRHHTGPPGTGMETRARIALTYRTPAIKTADRLVAVGSLPLMILRESLHRRPHMA